MRPGEWLDALRKIDVSDLDTNNIGSWPAPIKWLAGILLVAMVLGLGYNFALSDLENQLQQVREEENTLKAQFAGKAHMAANLERYTEQMKQMETSFGVCLLYTSPSPRDS